MCGIVGALTFSGGSFRVTSPYIDAMRDTMAHRGPDGAGTWISKDSRIGLGHRRLSIIDLSTTANQPMSNEDGSIQVVFNGEIYNHADIRKELEKTGRHKWRTDHSDTEVIVHAFEEWGIECLERFRGMFAIGLWDEKKRELWLVRDRIGIKPLYYSIHDGRIVFASEIKALLKDPDQKRAMSEESMFHYLLFLATPAPNTMFEGIRKLAGGTWLRVSEAGNTIEQRYWDVWDHTTPLANASEEEICERLMAELRTAVQLRKISDVPVGVFLSGGIDSSTNAALFSEGEKQPVRTFSIGYKGEYKSYPNELEYARLMAKQVGADHHERLLTQDDLLDFLPEMVRMQDEPIADPVCVPIYYVSKLARDNGVIVCQVGEGADELFWGYPGWKNALYAQRFGSPVPRFLHRSAFGLLTSTGRDELIYTDWLKRLANRQPLFWGGAWGLTTSQRDRVLSDRLQKRFAGMDSWDVLKPIRSRFEDKAWEKSDLNWMSYLDLSLRLPELLLMRVDKMSMAVSLECRVPFLDHKFVELALSIPQTMKTRNGKLKHILKRAVRGTIPEQLIYRRKQGFGVPIQEWLMGGLGNKVAEAAEQFAHSTGTLDPSEAKRIAAERGASPAWCLFNLALWHRQYIS